MNFIFKYPKAENLGVAIVWKNSWLTLMVRYASVRFGMDSYATKVLQDYIRDYVSMTETCSWVMESMARFGKVCYGLVLCTTKAGMTTGLHNHWRSDSLYQGISNKYGQVCTLAWPKAALLLEGLPGSATW